MAIRSSCTRLPQPRSSEAGLEETIRITRSALVDGFRVATLQGRLMGLARSGVPTILKPWS